MLFLGPDRRTVLLLGLERKDELLPWTEGKVLLLLGTERRKTLRKPLRTWIGGGLTGLAPSFIT